MSKDNPAAIPPPALPESCNVAVEVLVSHTTIGNALCGLGPCSFPLAASDARALADLGLVRVTGIFATA